MAKKAAKPRQEDEPNAKTVTVATEDSRLTAQRDIKIVGEESTYLTERPLTAVEEERQAAEYARQDLAQSVRAYLQNLAAAVADAPEENEPYRGLLDYNLRHASLFYGRRQAVAELTGHLNHDYLTVLHAASGAGKSSLLKAGVMPRLIAAGHLVVLARPSRDPLLAIKRTLLPNIDQTPPLLKASLRSFLWQVRRSGDLQPTTRIYLILDQFEEFFTQVEQPTQTRFLDELAQCLEDSPLKTYWVLSLRKEYLSDLAAFKSNLMKNPLANEYRLNFLSREETRDVIIEPAARRGVTFVPDLTEMLLDDLAETGFYPPHVQLVCHTLYQTRPNNESVISVDFYQSQGGAPGILRNYLDRVLQELWPGGQALARRLLGFFITSENQRIARSVAEITAEFVSHEAQTEALENVLRLLVNRHLLRRVEINEGGVVAEGYELAHDYLIDEVNLDPEVKARKAVKEMLAQEVHDYQRHHTLLSRDKLQFIESRLEPAELHDEAKELILCSALDLDYNLDFWLEQTPSDIRTAVLHQGLKSRTAGTRQRAASLAPESDDPALVERLAELMQNDSNQAVRQSAALSLAVLDQAYFNHCLRQMRGQAAAYPTAALEAMAYVQDERPGLLDLEQLPGPKQLVTWRMRWWRINHHWSQVGFTTLYAALGGALGAGLGGAMGAWGLPNHTALTIYAFFCGLVVGGGIGIGYGLAAVMDKHLGLSGYALSAALTGGILTVLFSIIGEARGAWYLGLGAALGLITGGLGGLTIAVITRLTQLRIEDKARRQAIRLGLTLVVGLLGGLILVWADHLRVFPPHPDHPPYGFLVGLLTVPGVVVIGLGTWNNS